MLQELGDKISRYVVMQKHQLIAAQLWTAHTWLYDYQVPIHSPILAATSAEPNSGKSTLVVVVGRASPRFSLNIEPTGPTLYRYVDATKPTIAIQEADHLFTRKSDLKHIINAGWTRGADAEFAVLRRKLARFAADNAAALKDAKPTLPSELINRDAANWWLLLAIAELAGGEWPKRAREEIAAISGHRTLKEIERYTAAADQAKLSKAAMAKLKANKRRT